MREVTDFLNCYIISHFVLDIVLCGIHICANNENKPQVTRISNFDLFPSSTIIIRIDKSNELLGLDGRKNIE